MALRGRIEAFELGVLPGKASFRKKRMLSGGDKEKKISGQDSKGKNLKEGPRRRLGGSGLYLKLEG